MIFRALIHKVVGILNYVGINTLIEPSIRVSALLFALMRSRGGSLGLALAGYGISGCKNGGTI